jgi:hypothetical protein
MIHTIEFNHTAVQLLIEMSKAYCCWDTFMEHLKEEDIQIYILINILSEKYIYHTKILDAIEKILEFSANHGDGLKQDLLGFIEQAREEETDGTYLNVCNNMKNVNDIINFIIEEKHYYIGIKPKDEMIILIKDTSGLIKDTSGLITTGI